jgi:hypothetical protein
MSGRLGFVLYLVLTVLALGFAGGWFAAWRKNHRDSGRLYEKAMTLFEQKEHILALMILCEANGHNETSETDRAIARILEELKQPVLAADAYCRARTCLGRNTLRYRKYGAYLYYREAGAYKDAGMHEFVYLRANAALGLIHTNQIERYFDGVDYEGELRVMRMFACMYQYKGTEAFQRVQEDAAWLLRNTENEKCRTIASSLNEVCFTKLSRSQLEVRWPLHGESYALLTFLATSWS